MQKRTNGKAYITFDYRKELTYPFALYKRLSDRLVFYKPVFGTKYANKMAERLSSIYIDKDIVPQYQVKDELGNVLFDSKWDNLQDFTG